jgi:hypothetical protein
MIPGMPGGTRASAPGGGWRNRIRPFGRRAAPTYLPSRRRPTPAVSSNGKPDWGQRITSLIGTATVAVAVAALLLTNEANREQERLTEQGQITDRFIRAVDQLGSSQVDIRLGGIYAMERIMRDSPADESTVVEVLAAYIRDHAIKLAPPQLYPSSPPPPPAPTLINAPPPDTDVQAALEVLGRRPDPVGLGRAPLELARLNLTHAVLTGAHLSGADLAYSNLVKAELAEADLSRAVLSNSNLIDADLLMANLTRGHLDYAQLSGADMARTNLSGAVLSDSTMDAANLTRANLAGANLAGAYMNEASLTGANLSGADLTDADLTGADLTDANFSNARLTGAKLVGAHASRGTRLPPGITIP